MLRKINDDLEKLYESVGEKRPMTVGTVKPGDLEGKTKERGPKGSGSESTDADCAKDAPSELQGDTVEKSMKKGKGMSRFDELYAKALKEDVAPGIEDKSFDTDIDDFPPAGEDEAAAEDKFDSMESEESLSDLFSSFADIASKIATKFQEQEGGLESDVLTDEPSIGPDEDITGEAVESKPAPDSVGKLTSKGNINTNAVKVSKGTAESKASGAKNEGKPEVAPQTDLNPKMKFKAKGSGPVADGKDASFFG